MDVPLGMLTYNGTCATRLFMHGAVADKKMIVQPESSIARSLMITMLVGYSLKLKQIDLIYGLKP
jgi:hypothetical protein